MTVMQNTMYEIYPVIDEMKCDKSKLSDSNSLMGHQAESNSSMPLQADDDKPNLGFVSSRVLVLEFYLSFLPLASAPFPCHDMPVDDGTALTEGNRQSLGKQRLSFHNHTEPVGFIMILIIRISLASS